MLLFVNALGLCFELFVFFFVLLFCFGFRLKFKSPEKLRDKSFVAELSVFYSHGVGCFVVFVPYAKKTAAEGCG
jgi:hypothetical protein